MQKILKYGIVYYKKECKVVLKNEKGLSVNTTFRHPQ